MATQTPLLAQSHVRPVLIEWSRWIAGGIMALLCSAIIIAGFVSVAQAVMHSFALVLLLLIGLFVVALAMFLPTLWQQTPPKEQL